MEIYEQLNENARIIVEPEQESYFDVYGEPDTPEDRADICDLIDRDGLWWYAAQRKCPHCGAWETVDSIGMIIGDIKPTGHLEDLESSVL
jgi:hypothetical protein